MGKNLHPHRGSSIYDSGVTFEVNEFTLNKLRELTFLRATHKAQMGQAKLNYSQ